MDSRHGLSGDTISTLVTRALGLFPEFESMLKSMGDGVSTESQFARFKLWVETIGAHRDPGRGSLEDRLRDASFIRNHIASLLQDLVTSIEEALLLGAGDQVSDDESQTSNSSVHNELDAYFQSDSNQLSAMEISLQYIQHVIDCLFRLSVTIRNPAPGDQYEFQSQATMPYLRWDNNHVRNKYPNLDEILVKRLGSALSRRRQYFKYREHHNIKMAQGIVDDGEDDNISTHRAPSVVNDLKGDSGGVKMRDDGESDISGTSYAMSLALSDSDRVPTMPQRFNSGPSPCPFCFSIVSIRSRKKWKRHVFRDLQPYVCLEKFCPTSQKIYQSRRDWITHMKEQHWRLWICRLGCPHVFRSLNDFESHVVEAHDRQLRREGKSLSRNDIESLESLSRHHNPDRIDLTCVLCSQATISSESEYTTHVGNHLEGLALFALPRIGIKEEEEEAEENQNVQGLSTSMAETTQYFLENQSDLPDGTVGSRPPYQTYDSKAQANDDSSDLDRHFKVAHSYQFRPGEIFKIYWSEPGSAKLAKFTSEPQVRVDRLGNLIFEQQVRVNRLEDLMSTGFRRFIVIANDDDHCTCVPILTYERKAGTKAGVKPDMHGIIYDEREHLHLPQGEHDLGFEPVRATMTEESETLAKESRVNYAKPSTVEHDSPVWFIGRVHPDDFHIVGNAYRKAWNRKDSRPHGSTNE